MNNLQNTSKPERIAKRMAAAGLCSRREAEAWILAGRVQVNGTLLTTPAHTVTPDDVILVDGKPLTTPTTPQLFRFHKPKGCLCTTKDPQGRPTIFDHLPVNMPRVVTIGRLDFNSEGLLLLTTDGEFAQKWMRSDLPRVYRVRIHGGLTDKALQRLQAGLRVKNTQYKPMQITLDDAPEKENRWYTFTLTEGKNREIRNAVEAVGGQVTRLIRTRYGTVDLGTLKRGETVEVPARLLKKMMD